MNIKEIANIKKNAEAGNYVAQEGYIPKTAEGVIEIGRASCRERV